MKREFALVDCACHNITATGNEVHFHIAGSAEVKWIEVFLNDELINILPIKPTIPVCNGDILKCKLPADGLTWALRGVLDVD